MNKFGSVPFLPSYDSEIMHEISLRAATTDDEGFALHVTEACMRAYAEQTWGTWEGQP
jgi:hypothetical protein